jgi:anti-sigma B factor antagonist
MTYSINKNGTVLEVTVNGRLDTVSSPDLEKALLPVSGDIEVIAYDFSGLDYISSAGLRTLLHVHRSMRTGGKTKITGCNQVVKEVFNVTGLSDVMEID